MSISSDTKLVVGMIVGSLCILLIGAIIVLRPEKIYEKSSLISSQAVTRGPMEASVYLVEFSDFQCPACKAFVPIVEQILSKYGDKITFAYRHFPLPQHPLAISAAYAFEAAHEQNNAWQMYTYLFNNQAVLSESVLRDGAKALDLDTQLFEQAMISKKYQSKIDQDIADAKRMGVNSTPTFFLNGKKLNLFSPDDLIKAVDEAINEQP